MEEEDKVETSKEEEDQRLRVLTRLKRSQNK
jgi:hypothetical protein